MTDPPDRSRSPSCDMHPMRGLTRSEQDVGFWTGYYSSPLTGVNPSVPSALGLDQPSLQLLAERLIQLYALFDQVQIGVLDASLLLYPIQDLLDLRDVRYDQDE